MHVRYTLHTALPPNAKARVVMPTIVPNSAARIEEVGSNRAVWTNGAYVPGADGVSGGAAGLDAHTVVFSVGSGAYTFVATSK